MLQLYGVASARRAPGSDAVALFATGDRSNAVIIATGNQRARLRGLQPGEVALYTDEGDYVKLSRGKIIEINCQTKVRIETPRLEVTGDIIDHCDEQPHTDADMRRIYNTHTHGGVQSGGGAYSGPGPASARGRGMTGWIEDLGLPIVTGTPETATLAGDILVRWDNTNSVGDWILATGDLQTGQDLETACLVSAVHRTFWRPRTSCRLDGTSDRRGWWGDPYLDEPIGSNLWQLERAKKIRDTLGLAQRWASDCLQWLVEDGIAASVAVDTRWLGGAGLNLHGDCDRHHQAGRIGDAVRVRIPLGQSRDAHARDDARASPFPSKGPLNAVCPARTDRPSQSGDLATSRRATSPVSPACSATPCCACSPSSPPA